MAQTLPDSLRNAIALFPARAVSRLAGDVDVGEVAEVGVFDHDDARVGLALEDVTLSGLDSLEPASLDWGRGADATLTLVTQTASLRGTYRVASSPVSRAALQFNTMLDGEAMVAATADADTDLARWFRDQELADSNNGRVINGMYMAHEDTINKLTTGKYSKSAGLRNELKKQRTRTTRDAARNSASEHQKAKLRGGSTDNVPPVGDDAQVSGGMTVQTYLIAAATEAAGKSVGDRDNEYAQLINSAKWFACAIKWARKRQSGAMTPQQILNIIANAKREEIDCRQLAAEANSAGEAVEPPMWPIDYDYFEEVYNARAERRLKRMQPASGPFSAEGVRVEIDVDLVLRDGGVSVDEIRPRVPLLRIRLEPGGLAGREALHARLDAFAGSTGFYIDLIRSRIIAALTAPATRGRFIQSLSA